MIFFCFMDAQPLAQKTIKIPLAKNRHFLKIWKGGKVRADYFRNLEDVFTFFCCWAGENMQLVIVWKHHVRDNLLWNPHNYKASRLVWLSKSKQEIELISLCFQIRNWKTCCCTWVIYSDQVRGAGAFKKILNYICYVHIYYI